MGQLHVVTVFVELTFDFSHLNAFLKQKKIGKEKGRNNVVASVKEKSI